MPDNPLDALRLRLRNWEDDRSLRLVGEWRRRGEVLDRLETPGFHTDALLSRQARALRGELEGVHCDFCAVIRDAIRHGRGAETMAALAGSCDVHEAPDGEGYDALDELIAEVLAPDTPLAEVGALLPDMVFYQPTPARHLLALLRRLDLRERDVLIDLGSGLGHLPLLAAILSPARCVGVELEPAYVASARRSAEMLALHRVRFVADDARTADLSAGTVFYLYSPFSGAMLADVLAILTRHARTRPLRIATLGPCTRDVAAMPWLRTDDAIRCDVPVLFHSG